MKLNEAAPLPTREKQYTRHAPVEHGRSGATSVDLFSYTLPEELIAKHPTERRDGSRLMVCPKGGGTVEHRLFHQITDYFRAGDLLLLNDNRDGPSESIVVYSVEGDELGLFVPGLALVVVAEHVRRSRVRRHAVFQVGADHRDVPSETDRTAEHVAGCPIRGEQLKP